jgi:hypothetical protein
MGIKGNFSTSLEVRVESKKSIVLTSASEFKDANAMRMQSEKPDSKLMLGADVVGDVMDELVASSHGHISIHHNYGTTFMSFGHSALDVDFSTSSTQRASIYYDHYRRNKRFQVDGEVLHDFQRWVSRGGKERQ